MGVMRSRKTLDHCFLSILGLYDFSDNLFLLQSFSEDEFPIINFPAYTLLKMYPKSHAVNCRLINTNPRLLTPRLINTPPPPTSTPIAPPPADFVSLVLVLIAKNMLDVSRVRWLHLNHHLWPEVSPLGWHCSSWS